MFSEKQSDVLLLTLHLQCVFIFTKLICVLVSVVRIFFDHPMSGKLLKYELQQERGSVANTIWSKQELIPQLVSSLCENKINILSDPNDI